MNKEYLQFEFNKLDYRIIFSASFWMSLYVLYCSRGQ